MVMNHDTRRVASSGLAKERDVDERVIVPVVPIDLVIELPTYARYGGRSVTCHKNDRPVCVRRILGNGKP